MLPKVEVHVDDVHGVVIWSDEDPDINFNPTGYVAKVLYKRIIKRPDNFYNTVILDSEDQLFNVHANTMEEVAAIIRKLFPHLYYIGNPVDIDDGTTINTWYVFIDKIGYQSAALDFRLDECKIVELMGHDQAVNLGAGAVELEKTGTDWTKASSSRLFEMQEEESQNNLKRGGK